MSKWLCPVLLFALVTSNAAPAAGISDDSQLERQLSLLDKISYHPSLLPLIMHNIDYLDLTADQQQRLLDWRENNAPAMLQKMKEVAQGRIDFIDLSLSPATSSETLKQQQRRLFRLQEEVLSYKLECRQNILETFTPDQWDALLFILADLQSDPIN
jgi:hypothetical protein